MGDGPLDIVVALHRAALARIAVRVGHELKALPNARRPLLDGVRGEDGGGLLVIGDRVLEKPLLVVGGGGVAQPLRPLSLDAKRVDLLLLLPDEGLPLLGGPHDLSQAEALQGVVMKSLCDLTRGLVAEVQRAQEARVLGGHRSELLRDVLVPWGCRLSLGSQLHGFRVVLRVPGLFGALPRFPGLAGLLRLLQDRAGQGDADRAAAAPQEDTSPVERTDGDLAVPCLAASDEEVSPSVRAQDGGGGVSGPGKGGLPVEGGDELSSKPYGAIRHERVLGHARLFRGVPQRDEIARGNDDLDGVLLWRQRHFGIAQGGAAIVVDDSRHRDGKGVGGGEGALTPPCAQQDGLDVAADGPLDDGVRGDGGGVCYEDDLRAHVRLLLHKDGGLRRLRWEAQTCQAEGEDHHERRKSLCTP